MSVPRSLFPVLLLAACGGCVNVVKKIPEKRLYALEARAPACEAEDPPPSPGPPLGGLELARLRISPRYEGKGFVYRTGPATFEIDFYNEFLVPPDLLVAEELRRGLGRSGLFAYVIEPSSRFEPALRLEGRVAALYADLTGGDAPRAVLETQLFLLEDDAVRLQRTYREEVPARDGSPGALVAAWNEALGRILAALERDLANLAPPEG